MRIRLIQSLIMIYLLFLSSQVSFTQQQERIDPDHIFSRGNSLYKEGKYEEAIREYKRLISHGFESGNLYYNIGNCYFKKGELSKAVLNYERARRLIPTDSDLRLNYEYAISLLEEKPQVYINSWFVRPLNILSQRSTIDGLTIFLSILYLFICMISIIGIFTKSIRRFYVPLISVLLVILILGCIVINSKIKSIGREAIIIEKEVKAKFEPFDNATTYFTLSEGSQIEVIEERDNWYKVKRPDGKIGWIERPALELVSSN